MVGIALLVVAVAAYAYAAAYGDQRDWLNSSDVVAAGTIGAIAAAVFLLWEGYGANNPIIPLGIISHRNVWLGAALGLGIGFPMFGLTELLRYLQGVLGFPLAFAGAVIAVRTLSLVIVAPLGTLLTLRAIDSRITIAVGFASSMFAFIWEAAGITSGSDFSTFFGAELLIGVGFGLTYAPLLAAVVSTMVFSEIPAAVAMMNLSFVLSGSFANASLSTVFHHSEETHLSHIAGAITLSRAVIQQTIHAKGSAAVHSLAQLAAQQATVLAFVDVAIFSAAVAALAIPTALSLRRAQKITLPTPAASAPVETAV